MTVLSFTLQQIYIGYNLTLQLQKQNSWILENHFRRRKDPKGAVFSPLQLAEENWLLLTKPAKAQIINKAEALHQT